MIVSVIDNLLKGAASQAVQNFNRMCGYEEVEGLVDADALRVRERVARSAG